MDARKKLAEAIRARLETERQERERLAARPKLAGDLLRAELEEDDPTPNRASWGALQGAAAAMAALAVAMRDEIETGALTAPREALALAEAAAVALAEAAADADERPMGLAALADNLAEAIALLQAEDPEKAFENLELVRVRLAFAIDEIRKLSN